MFDVVKVMFMENAKKKKMRKLLYVYIVIILVLIFSSRTIYNFSIPRVTVAMTQGGFITKELEAHAVVEFMETFDIIARSSGWIDEIFVSRGQIFEANTVIASYTSVSATGADAMLALRTNIERIEHQLMRQNASREDIVRNLQLIGTGSLGDMYEMQWAIDDALQNIDAHRLELVRVQGESALQRERTRLVHELDELLEALYILQTSTVDYDFDDFMYIQAINDASITLERRMLDLQNAEDELAAITNASTHAFDARSYQNAIHAAETAAQRNQLAYTAAQEQLNMAWNQFFLLSADADWLEFAAAQLEISNAERQVENIRLNIIETDRQLAHANSNLQAARGNFNTYGTAQRAQAIEAATANITQVENAVADAERAYAAAKAQLTRALAAEEQRQQDEIATTKRQVNTSQLALDENAWQISQELAHAETNLAQAYQALERVLSTQTQAERINQDMLADDMHRMQVDLRNIDMDIDRTMIDLRAEQAALDAIPTDVTSIVSSQGGIITAVEKEAGQFLSQGERIATAGVNNNSFNITLTASVADARFVEIGDIASVNASGQGGAVSATVYDISLLGDSLQIKLRAETDRFYGGEFVRVVISKQTGPHHMVVPNEAVFVGAMGQHYIWTVQRRQGSLGVEYIAIRRNVRVIDTDVFSSAIDIGFMMNDMPVVTSYSRALSVNGRVSRME